MQIVLRARVAHDMIRVAQEKRCKVVTYFWAVLYMYKKLIV